MCLNRKSASKMVENSDTSYENEIHRIDSPSNVESKNIKFCQGGPNFGEGTAAGQFMKNGHK